MAAVAVAVGGVEVAVLGLDEADEVVDGEIGTDTPISSRDNGRWDVSAGREFAVQGALEIVPPHCWASHAQVEHADPFPMIATQ